MIKMDSQCGMFIGKMCIIILIHYLCSIWLQLASLCYFIRFSSEIKCSRFEVKAIAFFAKPHKCLHQNLWYGIHLPEFHWNFKWREWESKYWFYHSFNSAVVENSIRAVRFLWHFPCLYFTHCMPRFDCNFLYLSHQ